MRGKQLKVALVVMGLFLASCDQSSGVGDSTLDAAAEKAKIISLIEDTWQTEHSIVDVAPIVFEAGYAIADWQQGDHAGRALLRADHEQWFVIVCSGKSLRTSKGLMLAGIDRDVADKLVAKLEAAEKAAGEHSTALFDRFEGQIVMSEQHQGH